MLSQRITCRVLYADTDNMGLAYHANYFRWFELGRTEMFRQLGMPYKEIEARGVFLPVAECFCKFTAPIRYDELLTVDIALDPGVRAAMKFDYKVFSERNAALAAKGYTKHPFTDRDGKVIRPPKFLLNIIAGHAAGHAAPTP